MRGAARAEREVGPALANPGGMPHQVVVDSNVGWHLAGGDGDRRQDVVPHPDVAVAVEDDVAALIVRRAVVEAARPMPSATVL